LGSTISNPHDRRKAMSSNRSVVYLGTRNVAIENRPSPKLEHKGKRIEHGAILKVVTTNICGSDQHIYRGRFSVPKGTVLGHEITATVAEVGRDVERLKVGDLVSVPFNVACGRCRNCKEGHTDVCETVNPDASVGAYGFDLGGWDGGQADYVLVPYADWNLLKFADRDRAMARIKDLTLISDILPTGHHGCVSAGVGPGATVYIAGAGPVGRCAAASARLLGAACIIVGDQNAERLKLLKAAGYETADLRSKTPLREQIAQITGRPEVDCGVDAVGFEAHGQGDLADTETPGAVLNALFDVVRPRGRIGVPGIYEPSDPGVTGDAHDGRVTLDWGKAWLKSLQVMTGMAPVAAYNRQLAEAILWDRMPWLGPTLNVEVVTLEEAATAYAAFDKGSPKKFVLAPEKLAA
jgi:glutathione-independent formaldehyde dehydrogenase